MAKIRRSDHAPAAQPRPQADPDAPAQAKARPWRRWLYRLTVVAFAALFLVSAGMLLKRFFEDRRTEQNFADLASLIAPVAPADSAAATAGEGQPLSNAERFAALREQNGDFVGWLSIEGTNLDLPVMQTGPDRADFYLRHDFNGEYSVYGVPYLDEGCTLSDEAVSSNLVIYGHNMKTGTIFGCLTGYKQASYYEEHPYIEFDNLYFSGKYEVFAAFAIDVAQDTSFVYNTYLDLDQAAFESYVSQVIARSDVKTGIVPAYGEELLTLSTCEYSTENGRYAVVARRVQQ